MAMNRNPMYDSDYVTLSYLKQYLGEEFKEEDFEYSKNFGIQPSPPYHKNDTWTDVNGRLYLCIKERLIGSFDASDWELIIDTEPYDKLVFEYADISINMLESQVYDHKIETYVQDVDPSTVWDTYTLKEYHVFDFWRDTSTDKEYVYNRKSGSPIEYYWEEHTCPAIVWDTTDGQKTIFGNKPEKYNTHDLWVIGEEVNPYDIPDNCKIGDVVVTSQNSDEFDKYHWSKAVDSIDLTINVPKVYSRIEIDRKNNILEDSVKSSLLQTENSILAQVESTYATQETVVSLDSELGELRDITTEQKDQLSSLEVTTGRIESNVTEINTKISDIGNITTSGESIKGSVDLVSVNASNPIRMNIYGIDEDISYLYPSDGLFPSDDLFPKIRDVIFTNTTTNEVFTYTLPTDLFVLNEEVYDQLVLDYDNGSVVVTRRCGINADGSKYELDDELYESYDYPYYLNLTDGNYTVSIPGYKNAYLAVSLMASNIYTTQFATKTELKSSITQTESSIKSEVSALYATKDELGTSVEDLNSSITQTATEIRSDVSATYATKESMSSSITQSANTINARVDKKFGDSFTSANIMLTINNDGKSSAAINADKINITGVITAINGNSTTTINGNKITTGTIGASQIKANAITSEKINSKAITADKINTDAVTSDKIKANAVTSNKIVSGAITSDKIDTGAVTADKIAAKAINADKIYGGTITASAINLGNGTFSVGTNGALKCSNITASGGSVGGWNLSAATIQKTVGEYSIEIRSDRGAGDPAILVYKNAGANQGYKWYVRPDGYMYSSNAHISGYVYATSGTFNGAINATNFQFGTNNTTGFMSMGVVSTHPWISGINVFAANGINFYSGTDKNWVGERRAYILADANNGIMELGSNSSIIFKPYNTTKGLYLGYQDAVELNFDSESAICFQNKQGRTVDGGGRMFYDSEGNGINPTSTQNEVATLGSISGRAYKKDITKLNNDDLNKLSNFFSNIPVARFKFKYGVKKDEEKIGFILEDIRDLKDEYKKYFPIKGETRYDTGDMLSTVRQNDTDTEVEALYYDNSDLISLLTAGLIAAHKKIERLEGKSNVD